jgi:hypothetical protein
VGEITVVAFLIHKEKESWMADDARRKYARYFVQVECAKVYFCTVCGANKG